MPQIIYSFPSEPMGYFIHTLYYNTGSSGCQVILCRSKAKEAVILPKNKTAVPSTALTRHSGHRPVRSQCVRDIKIRCIRRRISENAAVFEDSVYLAVLKVKVSETVSLPLMFFAITRQYSFAFLGRSAADATLSRIIFRSVTICVNSGSYAICRQ